MLAPARHGAARQVEPVAQIQAVAQIREQPRLPLHEQRRPQLGRLEAREQRLEAFEDGRVRLALGQRQRRERAGGRGRLERRGVVHETTGAQVVRLERERAQIVGRARPPGRLHAVALLKQRALATRRAAVHEPREAAVAAREHVGDRPGLAERPGPEHDGGVSPFHLGS